MISDEVRLQKASWIDTHTSKRVRRWCQTIAPTPPPPSNKINGAKSHSMLSGARWLSLFDEPMITRDWG